MSKKIKKQLLEILKEPHPMLHHKCGPIALSCPGAEIRIPRPEWIEVQFNSINGKENIRIFGGMNAIIVAHELDHLEGKLITYYVSSLGQEKSKWIIDAHIL